MSEITVQYQIINGPNKRADRLCVGDNVIVDNAVNEVVDAQFVNGQDHVQVQLVQYGVFTQSQQITKPRFSEFRTVKVVIASK